MNRDIIKSQPICEPMVDKDLHRMNGLQRASEACRYAILRWEYWAFPDGSIREWLRQNSRVFAWLIVPAISVMPVVSLILWQFTGWLAMLATIAALLTPHALQIAVGYIVFRLIVRFIKRSRGE